MFWRARLESEQVCLSLVLLPQQQQLLLLLQLREAQSVAWSVWSIGRYTQKR